MREQAPDGVQGQGLLVYLRDPRQGNPVPVPVLIDLYVLVEQEPLDAAQVVDDGFRPDSPGVVSCDEAVQDFVDALIVDVVDSAFFAERPELAQGDLVEASAVH